MRLTRNLFAWVLVGVFTAFLAVGVEMVSHKSFSHGSRTTSALSAAAPVSTVAANATTSGSTGSSTLISTTPITITRTYQGDDSGSPSETVTGSGVVGATYHGD